MVELVFADVVQKYQFNYVSELIRPHNLRSVEIATRLNRCYERSKMGKNCHSQF
jgi:hypothetical protein